MIDLTNENGMPLACYCLMDQLATKGAVESVRELIAQIKRLPTIDLGEGATLPDEAAAQQVGNVMVWVEQCAGFLTAMNIFDEAHERAHQKARTTHDDAAGDSIARRLIESALGKDGGR